MKSSRKRIKTAGESEWMGFSRSTGTAGISDENGPVRGYVNGMDAVELIRLRSLNRANGEVFGTPNSIFPLPSPALSDA